MSGRTSSWLFAAVCMFTVAGFALLMYVSFAGIEPGEISAEAVAGKRIWQKEGCVECHAIFGNGSYSAPDLTHITDKRNAAWLTNYLINPPVIYPHDKRKHPAVSEPEARRLAEYFQFIGSVNTTNWPPKPIATP